MEQCALVSDMLRNLSQPEKRDFAILHRNRPTPAEAYLWGFLRKERAKVKFRRQSVIRGYIADFYCPKVHLVVEVDGASHDCRKEYDANRDQVFARLGIVTLRFTNQEVLEQCGRVVEEIRQVAQNRLLAGIKPFHGPLPLEKK
jgi:very-short-patch-repair endonuclease